MDRRNFLSLTGAGLGATFLSQCRTQTPNPKTNLKSPTPVTPVQDIYRSQGGLLEVNLDARSMLMTIGQASGNLLSYGGRIPGPLLEAKPGDTVKLHLRNALAAPTNLHFHGLHIPPTGNGDNPFRQIPPNEQFTYEFTLPTNHPSTLAYYHPHLHGYVAQQIFGGLGGTFVVRGELDKIPEIQAAQEEFLFLKDFDLSQNSNVTSSHMGVQMVGREGETLTVNGQVRPNIKATKGLLRFRITNASTSRFYRLQLEEHPLYLIATDGHSLNRPQATPELLLSPGERADVLVKVDREPGEYRLLNRPYQRANMGMMMGHRKLDQQASLLATISYPTKPKAVPLPNQLIARKSLSNPITKRQFTMNHGMAPGQGMMFLLNGKPFRHDQIDTMVKLGSTEEWEIRNTGVMDHPFHIHTNPFQIIQRNGQTLAAPIWKDTVLVKTGESVKIRIAFQDYLGKTVYHCHILDHEDLGMMGIIDIQA